jgi:hypothetical protein
MKQFVRECAGYEESFGEMLLERHPTMRIEVRGEKVPPHRFSLCFAPDELYVPKTAEQLASLRVSREKKKAERELQQWQEDNPLFVASGVRLEDG